MKNQKGFNIGIPFGLELVYHAVFSLVCFPLFFISIVINRKYLNKYLNRKHLGLVCISCLTTSFLCMSLWTTLSDFSVTHCFIYSMIGGDPFHWHLLYIPAINIGLYCVMPSLFVRVLNYKNASKDV
ncbi:MAG: hypothetical protein COB02_17975 [Candidatus Cloacimonadota bacterium]|nr:MAG: hypothetical protein COB02_17975 [Candidatus Cloacimonadota bacterium]